MSRSGQLEIRALSKSFRMGGRPLTVLSNLAFSVDPGAFVSVVGASGCGKSTLLRLIIGLDPEYDGDILLDGSSIKGVGTERSIVFQDHRLFPWLTVEQNVALGLEASRIVKRDRRAAVQEHIDLVRLGGFEKAYPHQLSGGMAQRAAIARALVGRPELLLLDEPLGALDSLTRSYLQDELRRIWMEQRCSVIMVTHDVEEAVYLSDAIVVMKAGPGRISAIIKVDLPLTRDRTDQDFLKCKEKVRRSLVH